MKDFSADAVETGIAMNTFKMLCTFKRSWNVPSTAPISSLCTALRDIWLSTHQIIFKFFNLIINWIYTCSKLNKREPTYFDGFFSDPKLRVGANEEHWKQTWIIVTILQTEHVFSNKYDNVKYKIKSRKLLQSCVNIVCKNEIEKQIKEELTLFSTINQYNVSESVHDLNW